MISMLLGIYIRTLKIINKTTYSSLTFLPKADPKICWQNTKMVELSSQTATSGRRSIEEPLAENQKTCRPSKAPITKL